MRECIFAAVLVTLAAPSVACGSSDVDGTGGASGDGGAGQGGATATGATGTGATGTGGDSAELTCDYYCAKIMGNCVDGNQQYPSEESCQAACETYPPGALGDRRGDTLGCRIYQLGFLKLSADTKCAHGGPSGGDLRGGLDGICGDGCEAFCALEAAVCDGENQQYADSSACLAACDAFPGPESSNDFDVGDQAEDTFNCRLYHLTAATSDPATHCPHTKPSETGDPCSGM